MSARPRRLRFSTVARRVASLRLVDEGARWEDPTGVAAAMLPAWVRAAGMASADDVHWLWIDAEEGAAAGTGTADSQAVLEAAPGRYAIDTIDPETGKNVAREIASAAPLVIGLPRRGGAVLLRIEAIRTTN